eukprot:263057_1
MHTLKDRKDEVNEEEKEEKDEPKCIELKYNEVMSNNSSDSNDSLSLHIDNSNTDVSEEDGAVIEAELNENIQTVGAMGQPIIIQSANDTQNMTQEIKLNNNGTCQIDMAKKAF